MTAALAVVFGAYALAQAGVAALILRQRRPAEGTAPFPTVAVVVAARDEQGTIEACLDALLAQDYPPDRLVAVVADDHSTDDTAGLVRRVEARAPGRVRYVRVPDPVGSLRGKAQALHSAIEAVDAEVLLITDADCRPVASWARTMAAAFADPTVGVTCGLSRIAPRPGRLFDRVQALDWRLLLAVVSTAAEAGAPTTGMGNNMGVRRAAYDAVGGYPALPFSVTEDFTLVRAIADTTDWRVRFPLDARTVVWTMPADGVADAYRQRRRWASGGLSDGRRALPLYALLFGVHALLAVGLALAPVAGLAALLVKTLADGAVLWAAGRRIGAGVGWAPLLGLEAFLMSYSVSLPFVLALRPRIGWKGRQH